MNNTYPYIFVHGLNGWGQDEGLDRLVPYFGATTGGLIEYLRNKRYDCFSASVGPFSSCWDRACELYAQITGQRVDYGEAHSKKYHHKRYGRNYSVPLIKNWGQLDANGKIQKVHLIGHSFGGTTIRLMVHLLMNGSPEEQAATTDGSISELFTGGKEDWVHSVVTICTPHNSSTTYYFAKDFHLFNPIQVVSAIYAGALGRTKLNGKVVDFHMEQFGLTNIPGQKTADSFVNSVKNYMDNYEDSCLTDLTPYGAKKINDMIETSPNIYYFSYPFSTSLKNSVTGKVVPRLTTNPIIVPISWYMGLHKPFTDEFTGEYYDEKWQPNDSLVNTISATYPFDEDHIEYEKGMKLNTGVWHVMPERVGDHGQAIGLFANKHDTRDFYNEIAELLLSIE